MGLMMSVLVFSIGVLEALSCVEHMRHSYLPLDMRRKRRRLVLDVGSGTIRHRETRRSSEFQRDPHAYLRKLNTSFPEDETDCEELVAIFDSLESHNVHSTQDTNLLVVSDGLGGRESCEESEASHTSTPATVILNVDEDHLENMDIVDENSYIPLKGISEITKSETTDTKNIQESSPNVVFSQGEIHETSFNDTKVREKETPVLSGNNKSESIHKEQNIISKQQLVTSCEEEIVSSSTQKNSVNTGKSSSENSSRKYEEADNESPEPSSEIARRDLISDKALTAEIGNDVSGASPCSAEVLYPESVGVRPSDTIGDTLAGTGASTIEQDTTLATHQLRQQQTIIENKGNLNSSSSDDSKKGNEPTRSEILELEREKDNEINKNLSNDNHSSLNNGSNINYENKEMHQKIDVKKDIHEKSLFQEVADKVSEWLGFPGDKPNSIVSAQINQPPLQQVLQNSQNLNSSERTSQSNTKSGIIGENDKRQSNNLNNIENQTHVNILDNQVSEMTAISSNNNQLENISIQKVVDGKNGVSSEVSEKLDVLIENVGSVRSVNGEKFPEVETFKISGPPESAPSTVNENVDDECNISSAQQITSLDESKTVVYKVISEQCIEETENKLQKPNLNEEPGNDLSIQREVSEKQTIVTVISDLAGVSNTEKISDVSNKVMSITDSETSLKEIVQEKELIREIYSNQNEIASKAKTQESETNEKKLLPESIIPEEPAVKENILKNEQTQVLLNAAESTSTEETLKNFPELEKESEFVTQIIEKQEAANKAVNNTSTNLVNAESLIKSEHSSDKERLESQSVKTLLSDKTVEHDSVRESEVSSSKNNISSSNNSSELVEIDNQKDYMNRGQVVNEELERKENLLPLDSEQRQSESRRNSYKQVLHDITSEVQNTETADSKALKELLDVKESLKPVPKEVEQEPKASSGIEEASSESEAKEVGRRAEQSIRRLKSIDDDVTVLEGANPSFEWTFPPVEDASSPEKAFWLIFSGEYTKAMSKDWHSGHFCCWQCDESLTGQRYVLRDDHPYCIKCYEQVFANTCDECSKVIGIDSKDLSYKDKHWHEACFLCSKCRVSLVDKQFGSKADKIYCGNCYDAQFASRCDGCGQIFRAGTKKMEYKTRQWHEQCFCCCVCKTPIGTKSFIPREQEIYCAGCYEEKFATRCVKCNKIITSGGVTYKNEPWHRECFTCTNCSTSLAGQRFTSRDEKPYCADCFGELFAKRCTACCKPITGIGGTRFISFEDRHWHNDCFICASCRTSLVGRGFITDAEDILCTECAKQKLM